MIAGLDVMKVQLYEGDRVVGVRFYGRDAAPGGRTVDVTGFAARLILEDQARLGRKRARSGAEKILRAAGFSDPGRMYAFAMDRIGADRRRAA